MRSSLVTRLQLHEMSLERLEDAKCLMEGQRWTAAYYIAGYALECALKACLLKYIGESGAVFGKKDYAKKQLPDCWTHDLMKLLELSGLKDSHQAAIQGNATFLANWGIVKDWNESSRYATTEEVSAKALYNAIIDSPDGILPWIQQHW